MPTLIANTGIQFLTFRIEINPQDRFKEWFHEWYDSDTNEWKLEPAYCVQEDDHRAFFRKIELIKNGYLAPANIGEISIADLKHDGLTELMVDDDMCPDVPGEIFSMTFADKDNHLERFENRWLPIPYFFKRGSRIFRFGPLNWSRFKMIPVSKDKGLWIYDIILAFDTYATYVDQGINEHPVFPDLYSQSIELALCENESHLLDYCSTGKEWSHINKWLMHLAHPDITRIDQLRGNRVRHMGYAASYIFLMNYFVDKHLFPTIRLYKDRDVPSIDVDMVIDIGNSRTTALLIEDNTNFNQVRPLRLIDYSSPLKSSEDEEPQINSYSEPFDMRLAFRKADFGNFGFKDSRQFVYPSLVRLGQEANRLIHMANITDNRPESPSTYSSPKRYLWDWRRAEEEWQYLVLPDDENTETTLKLTGVTSQMKGDGRLVSDTEQESGDISYHYSRRSLMTLSFLEMLAQAQTQINSESHRSIEKGFGNPEKPRRIKRIIVTCPTAMSKVEREALVHCARDAVKLLANFTAGGKAPKIDVEVIPTPPSRRDAESEWYYDEATCSQLVYIYGEVGHKYKGNCTEFFNLYGKVEPGETQPTLTVGSLDIGAGTSDLMINRYTYTKDDITTLTPEPLFYDSFYFAGDDMLNGLIKNYMLLPETSAFRQELKNMSYGAYRQTIRDFFGPDYNGQTLADRILRKDFNIQYSVPLMCYFLELVKNDSKDCVVRYENVFADCPPNPAVIEGFKNKTGIDVTTLDWKFDKAEVSSIIEKEFEPLLKKIATIMYAYACDVVLLSGRPASLPAIRDIFLKYFAISPHRLIMLNNYYVGDWYPFDNNTGYITNPKTIVAMGGVIGHYASALSNLNRFVVNLDKLKEGLKSTVNYVESSRETQPIQYCITPQKGTGDLTVSVIPTNLNVRQIGMDSYPGRALYTIDFNRFKMKDRIIRKALIEEGVTLTDANVQARIKDEIDRLKQRMPFKLTLERDPEDKETLTITSIIDRNGNEVADSNIEIYIQSLGVDEQYWLDSGAFNF